MVIIDISEKNLFKNLFHWKFFKVGSVIAYSFVKKFPKIQECWLAPVSLRGLVVKGIYEVCKPLQVWANYCKGLYNSCKFLKRF